MCFSVGNKQLSIALGCLPCNNSEGDFPSLTGADRYVDKNVSTEFSPFLPDAICFLNEVLNVRTNRSAHLKPDEKVL